MTGSRSAAVHRVHPADDVAVALRPLEPGERIDFAGGEIVVRDAVPQGHKLALRAIGVGETVRKFGWPIGAASAHILAGRHVHTHNLGTMLTEAAGTSLGSAPGRGGATASELRFQGYRRSDGRVGTRNEIWILCTVGCVAQTARRLAAGASRQFAGCVDGIYAFTHPFGCSQLGDDLDCTRRILASLASHPNAGGALIVGLGCESNQLGRLLDEIPADRRARVRSFAAQAVDDEDEHGLALIGELVAIAEADRRADCALGELALGLKCGGSDGFSGLTANPLVGRVADVVAASGGTPILSEIPELFGAEHLLAARAYTEAVAAGVETLVGEFKNYFVAHGQPVHENPSPGNLAGGITTLEEKSLGAVQKSGSSPLTQILRYGERVQASGLALLEAPGNDAVSSTALAAAGATLILFTTGRGTPLGFPVPTLKIASNSDLAQRKPGWIDFDAGRLIAGEPVEALERDMLELIVETASGRPTRAERNDEREIAIWKLGVTL
jgi:altronate hydrolase